MEFHPKRRNFELVRAILKIFNVLRGSRGELSHKYLFAGVSISEKKLAHGTNPLPLPSLPPIRTVLIYQHSYDLMCFKAD